MKKSLALFTTLVFVLCLCFGAVAAEDKLNIVSTTTMLNDLARIIGGDKVETVGLMGPGIDPHLYDASAGDVTKLLDADVVLFNGIHLEGQMGEVLEQLKEQGKNVITIEDAIPTDKLLFDPANPTAYDPHIWFDVSLWRLAANHVGESLCTIDAANAETYKANLEAYLVEMDNLATYCTDRIKEVPEDQRVLVTAHDAFEYFGNAFGFDVRGLQGISTEAEAGTADVSDLAAFIADNKIKAIFVESSVPPKNIEALQEAVKAKGFDVAIGGELYSDSLGDASTGHDTYITTVKANIDTITNALK